MSTSQPESDLHNLLCNLQPVLLPSEYVYCTLAPKRIIELASLAPLASFHEREGLSVLLPLEQADAAGLSYGPTLRCITLTVHSSLTAVGLTAAVATQLAKQGISANVVAAFHHDHILVPTERATDAFSALQDFQAEVIGSV